MTLEGKELLLKDLCARLPYGVICYGVTKDMDEDGNYIDKVVTGTLYELHSYKCCYGLVGLMNQCNIESIKPYLRPMSSMTDEEEILFRCELPTKAKTDAQLVAMRMELFLKGYLDYNHLIEKGLALEAPEGMYKTK